MRQAKTIVQRGILYISALVLVAGYPTAAMATSQEPVTDPIEVLSTEATEVPVEHTYDPETKKWNSDEWHYNGEAEAYEKPLEPIIIEPHLTTDELPEQPSAVATTDSVETTEKSTDSTVEVANDVKSDAASGDAVVSNNTLAGSALTGDATVDATIINAVNSSITADDNQKIATFTKDVYGDVEGDIILYPMLLKAMLEQQAQQTAATAINSTTDFDLKNNIDLNAKTGNAAVDSNTTAGDATTGTATAMANVINILNSMIAMQDSFIGTINIYGSLEGDILIAPDFIPQMLSNNGTGDGSDMQLSSHDTTTIINNISAVAESGAAEVFGNTNGGSANTGDATSSVVIFNVTGRDIVAENSMLVFVNVLGRWVGMIVDAPVGATAAMIGSGVQSNEMQAPDLVLQSESKHGITNTISVHASSGDAAVSNNTTGGNATSGNANAFTNVANVSSSTLSLTGWFGLLFINITGDWFGSFGVDTSYGNVPETTSPQPPGPVQFVPNEDRPVRTVNSAANRTIIDSRTLHAGGPVAMLVDASPVSDLQKEQIHASFASEPEILGTMSDTPALADTEETSNFLFLAVAGFIVLLGGSFIGLRKIV